MPVYNAADYLDHAIMSVVTQSFGDIELICVNDGSTDQSLDILCRWRGRDDRIIVLSRPNTGIVGALNEGLAAAKCELIARMDADDISLPTRFAKQVAYLRSHSDCIAVGSTAVLIDADGSPITRWEVPADHAQISSLHLEGRPGQIIHPSLMMRRSAVIGAGGYRSEWQWVEDYDLFLRLAEIGNLANIQEDLLLYRDNLCGVTHTKRRQQEQFTTELCNQFRRQKGLPAISRPEAEMTTNRKPHDVLANWIEWAWRAGNYRTAQKHARRLLCDRKLDSRSWRLFLKAYLGPLSIPIGNAKRVVLRRSPFRPI